MVDEIGGIRKVRQMFAAVLPLGWAVVDAKMRYEHSHDVEWQVLMFRVIGPDGKPRELESDKVPARDDINELAVATAKKFVAGLPAASQEATGNTIPFKPPEP